MITRANSNKRFATVAGALLACGFFFLGTFQAWWHAQRIPPSRRNHASDLIYLPSPTLARVMSLGYVSLTADYYWVKALQYYTEPTQAYNDFKNLADFLEIVVGIDPSFKYAYKFAGLAIPYDSGRWNWRHTQRATEFLELGVKRFPDEWQLHFLLGYNYLNYHGRHEDAAAQFALAARLPEAPEYLNAFAARVLAVGGEVDKAIALTEEILRTSDEPAVVEMMAQRLEDLRAEKESRRIEAAVEEFKRQHQRLPFAIEELLRFGFLDQVPAGFTLDSSGKAVAPASVKRMILHKNNHEGDYVVHD